MAVAGPRNHSKSLQFREKMNRRKAVFCLFRRIPSQFDSFQQIFSLFNELSGCLEYVRNDHDWFDVP